MDPVTFRAVTNSSPSGLTRRRRLGELLVDAGVLDDARLKAALAEQRKWGGKLGRTLVEMGFVEEATMVNTLAQQLRLAVVNLDELTVPHGVVERLRLDLAERYGVFPVTVDFTTNVMRLATADPTNVEALQELHFATNMKIEPLVASQSGIERAIRRHYFGENTSPTATTTPQALGVNETIYELDELLGEGAAAAAPKPTPVSKDVSQVEALRREVGELQAHVQKLEAVAQGQIRSLRAVLELLLEAGLVSREEYLAKLNRPE